MQLGVDKELDYNYSLNSAYAQAKAVFSKQALKLYKDNDLRIPTSIYEFLNVSNLESANMSAYSTTLASKAFLIRFSTYAMIIGVLALAFAAYRRRKQ